jgi:hypothetical protein
MSDENRSTNRPSLKHSRVGVVSVLLAVLTFLLVIADIYLAFSLALWQVRRFVLIPMCCLSFLGLILGIVGFRNSGSKKSAVLGTVSNLLALGWAGLLCFTVSQPVSVP